MSSLAPIMAAALAGIAFALVHLAVLQWSVGELARTRSLQPWAIGALVRFLMLAGAVAGIAVLGTPPPQLIAALVGFLFARWIALLASNMLGQAPGNGGAP